MRKLLRKKPLAIATTLVILGWSILSLFSQKQEPALLQIFAATGFEEATLPEPEKKRGIITYNDIPLDPDGFSSIRRLEIERSLSGKIQSIRIEGLSLTGELQEDLTVTMAGWSKPSAAALLNLSIPEDAKISIQNAKIELLSEALGGIGLQFNLEIQHPGKEGREFQARLKGAQTQLSYDANISGLITRENIWQVNAEIEQAKFDLGHLKSTRISGLIGMSGEKFQSSEILGNLQAGGLTLLGLPWQNVAITLDGSLNKTRMIIGAKSAGIEGVELGLTLGDLQKPTVYAGSLHCESLGDLLEYLKSNDALPFAGIPSGNAEESKSLDAEFRGNANAIIFDLAEQEGTPAISFLIKPTQKKYGLNDILEGKPFNYVRRENGQSESADLAYIPNENRITDAQNGRTATLNLRELKIDTK